MASDWLKLHRSIVDTSFWHDDFLVRLWIWCLVKANYKDSKWRGVEVKRGEFITGRNRAAEELHVSPSKWMRGIERLIAAGCIKYEADSNWTRISVCNYRTYQDGDQQDRTTGDTTGDTSDDTTSGQPAIQPVIQVMTQPADTREERQEAKNYPLSLTPTRNAWKQIPFVADKPDLQDAIAFWLANWPSVNGGPQSDEIRIETRLAEAIDAGWSADKIVRSIRFSVNRCAKRWLDPDDDWSQQQRGRNGKRKLTIEDGR